jgi:hypothetical protein
MCNLLNFGEDSKKINMDSNKNRASEETLLLQIAIGCWPLAIGG